MNKTNQLLQFIYNQIRGYKKNRGNSRRFKSYYMSSKEDTRENSAKIIDYFAGRIFSFFYDFCNRLHKVPAALFGAGLYPCNYYTFTPCLDPYSQ